MEVDRATSQSDLFYMLTYVLIKTYRILMVFFDKKLMTCVDDFVLL